MHVQTFGFDLLQTEERKGVQKTKPIQFQYLFICSFRKTRAELNSSLWWVGGRSFWSKDSLLYPGSVRKSRLQLPPLWSWGRAGPVGLIRPRARELGKTSVCQVRYTLLLQTTTFRYTWSELARFKEIFTLWLRRGSLSFQVADISCKRESYSHSEGSVSLTWKIVAVVISLITFWPSQIPKNRFHLWDIQ